MNNPIAPTVGRVVYFTPASTSPLIRDYKSGVCTALITAVHNDNCVNLAVFDANGQHHSRCSVCHVSTVPADDDAKKYDTWDWMPYQKGQAAKTEQLEAKLVSGSAVCDESAKLVMDFGGAIEVLKQGHAVARKGWNGKGMWIALGQGNEALEAEKFWNPHSRAHAVKQGGTAKVEPYIIFKNAQDNIQMGWQPSQADVLANDWVVVSLFNSIEPLSPHNTINS